MPRSITSSVVLLLVIGGAQAEPTAVAQPAARDSTAGRGWGHKNKGGHHGAHFLSSPCPLLLLPSIPQELRDCVYTWVRATFTLRWRVSKRRAAVPRPPLRARAFILFFSLSFSAFPTTNTFYVFTFGFCRATSSPRRLPQYDHPQPRIPTDANPSPLNPASSVQAAAGKPSPPRVCVGAEIEFGDVDSPAFWRRHRPVRRT
jgi:hypothetical protein